MDIKIAISPIGLFLFLGRSVTKVYSYIYFQSWRNGLWTPEDRKYLVSKILEPVAHQELSIQKTLFVGVQDYCKNYFKNFKKDQIFTIDSDPAAKEYGADHHYVESFLNFELILGVSPGFFDLIVLNGVFGYGINAKDDTRKALEICQKYLGQNGYLVLGYNPGLIATIDFEASLNKLGLRKTVWPTTMDERVQFQMPFHKNLSHVYEFYQRK